MTDRYTARRDAYRREWIVEDACNPEQVYLYGNDGAAAHRDARAMNAAQVRVDAIAAFELA